jgi:glycosyltransferase involved in cell wall biosynthesis
MAKRKRICLGLVLVEDPEWIGGSVYVRNVVYTLSSLPDKVKPEIQLIGVGDPNSPLVRDLCLLDFVRPLAENAMASVSRGNGRIDRIVKFMLAWADHKLLRRTLSGPDIVFPAFGLHPIGVPKLHWLPDFQHLRLPHLFLTEERETRTKGMAEIANLKGMLLLSSRSAADDFHIFFPDARIRTRVWSFCSTFDPVEAEGGSIARYDLPEKYLYLPNQFWVHKDHLTVFKALNLLNARGIKPPVVCTGLQRDRRNPDHFPMLADFVKRNDLDGQVRFLGMVPRNDQVEIFRYAAAVVQPSLFEGWSTVVEDTKTLGRPIILSDIPPHQEQVSGDMGKFFRAGSAEDLARVIEDQWEILIPGPDAEAEHAAMARTAGRRRELAFEFMQILEEAIAAASASCLKKTEVSRQNTE